MNLTRLKIPTIVLAVVALVIGVSSGAVAAKLITGKDIKDGTVTSADIKNGTLVTKDLKHKGVNGNRLQKATVDGAKLKKGTVGNGKLKDGTITGKKIKDGTIESQDLSAAAKASLQTTFAGPNWAVIDRNVVGNGDSYLRGGPFSAFPGENVHPPMGIGSLGMRTGSGTDSATFGDQVDFQGMAFNALSKLDYWSFTTNENIAAGGANGVNLVSLEIEVDPNLANSATNFSTAGFLPAAASNTPGWTDIDAITTGRWFLTGAAGTATNCTLAAPCTWATLKAALANATIFTVEFTKGHDFAYSGAVDKLQTNDPKTPSTIDIFDFEPFGVSITHP